jgi:hypothetical protein
MPHHVCILQRRMSMWSEIGVRAVVFSLSSELHSNRAPNPELAEVLDYLRSIGIDANSRE